MAFIIILLVFSSLLLGSTVVCGNSYLGGFANSDLWLMWKTDMETQTSPVTDMMYHTDTYRHVHRWLYDTAQSNAGLASLACAVAIASVTSEACSALYTRLRDRPLFWLGPTRLTIFLHNFLASLLHGVRVAVMFSLMMVFMTLDPCLCVVMVMGHILGHLVCHWSFAWVSDSIVETKSIYHWHMKGNVPKQVQHIQNEIQHMEYNTWNTTHQI